MSVESDGRDLRELDQRTGDGLEVTLLWSERTGSVFVSVEDRRTDVSFRLPVDPAAALDAFRHPYAYSRRRYRGDGSSRAARRRTERLQPGR